MAGYNPGVNSAVTESISAAYQAFYVLDRDMRVVLAWNANAPAIPQPVERLPPALEACVRDLTAGWAPEGSNTPGIARPVPSLVLRTHPLLGPAGLFVGVRLDRYRPPNSLTGLAARYRITPREVEVLALLLDGLHLVQVGERLYITSSTVQDHIKSMLDKTASRNRSELIARMLGWEPESEAREA
jgi:DNA-binding CsgD family transcriptional regulator